MAIVVSARRDLMWSYRENLGDICRVAGMPARGSHPAFGADRHVAPVWPVRQAESEESSFAPP